MKKCALLLSAAFACAGAGPANQYKGVITDDMCAGDHKMMGGTDAAKCTVECVKSMHSKYVLKSGRNTWILSDQTTPEKFAGRNVIVTGTLNGKQLQVSSITATP